MVTKALFTGCGGHLALDFANSIDRNAGSPSVERLRQGYADLVRWSAEAGALGAMRARRLVRAALERPSEAAAVFERAIALREATFRAFDALVRGRRPTSADLAAINAELASALAHARVERDGDGFSWTWDAEDGALDAPLWPIVRSVAELLVAPERTRVKRCASGTCLWLFLDATKNRQRRWCDMKLCGNRAKVRKHRARYRAGG